MTRVRRELGQMRNARTVLGEMREKGQKGTQRDARERPARRRGTEERERSGRQQTAAWQEDGGD